MLTTERPDDMRLLVWSEDDRPGWGSPTRRVMAAPVGLGDDPGNRGHLRVTNHYGTPWYHLTATAYVDGTGPNGARVFGLTVEHRDIYSADVRDLTAMLKVAREVERKMAKLAERFGYVGYDAGTFFARVGDALGVTHYGWKVEGRADMDGTGYRWTTDATIMQSHVGRLVADIAKAPAE